MPIVKWLPPHARKTEATKTVRPRLEIVEEILMLTTPKWDWKKFKKSMTLPEACGIVGISDMTLRNWRNEHPKIGEYFNSVREARKEMAHHTMEQAAINNVMDGIGGGVKLRPLDKINISLRYLEKTSAEFNPSIKLDVESNNKTIISMSTDEMTQRVLELSAMLWLNNQTTNDNKWTDDSTTDSTTNNEE
mgnify:CR=1 FL=1